MSAHSTKLAIVSSLDMLMAQKPFEQISVSDVCEAAQVARSTFYRHFSGMADIVFWMWDQANVNGIYQEGRTLSCHDAHLYTFEELRKNRRFFMVALETVDCVSLVQYGGRVMQRYLEDVYRAKTGRGFTEREALLVEFFSTGAKHMTRHWAKRGMAEEPAVMADVFEASMPAFMLPYLEPDPSCAVEVLTR